MLAPTPMQDALLMEAVHKSIKKRKEMATRCKEETNDKDRARAAFMTTVCDTVTVMLEEIRNCESSERRRASALEMMRATESFYKGFPQQVLMDAIRTVETIYEMKRDETI